MSKPEVRKTSGGVQAKNMRQKLANLRKNKSSKNGEKEPKNTIMNSFGKRKLSTEDSEPEKKIRSVNSSNPISQSALDNIEQFAADSDE